ncbi:unnamed protein product [Amoebophrya sp. A120]|nr:unnamed protein product [Amoebophrya sp. A120]|eukprot:GSA120T00005763001.1
MLVLSSGLLNCGDPRSASDRAKVEFMGSIFMLTFNFAVYTNFMQYMWRKGREMGRKTNPAAYWVYLLILALILLNVDHACTVFKFVGWDNFSEEVLPRHYACEGEGANRKCKKLTLFGWAMWASTVAGLLFLCVSMWGFTVMLGSNCVVSAYQIAKRRSAGGRQSSYAGATSGQEVAQRELDQVSDHAGSTSRSASNKPQLHGRDEGELHSPDLESGERTALLSQQYNNPNSDSQEEEPAMEPQPFDFRAQMDTLRDEGVDLLGSSEKFLKELQQRMATTTTQASNTNPHDPQAGIAVALASTTSASGVTMTQSQRQLQYLREHEGNEDSRNLHASSQHQTTVGATPSLEERIIGGGGERMYPNSTTYSGRIANQSGQRASTSVLQNSSTAGRRH